MKFVAVQPELQHAMTIPVVWIALRSPDAAVPDQYRPPAVLLGGDDAFELRVFQWMVFDMHGQALLARIETWPLWHGPALQGPIELEPEIIVEARRGMFLNDIDRPFVRRTMSRMTGRLRAFHKVALPAIPLQLLGHRGAFHRSSIFMEEAGYRFGRRRRRCRHGIPARERIIRSIIGIGIEAVRSRKGATEPVVPGGPGAIISAVLAIVRRVVSVATAALHFIPINQVFNVEDRILILAFIKRFCSRTFHLPHDRQRGILLDHGGVEKAV